MSSKETYSYQSLSNRLNIYGYFNVAVKGNYGFRGFPRLIFLCQQTIPAKNIPCKGSLP